MVLNIKDIKKGFGGTEVLKGVNARLLAGERIAIIGENGAGKTTLLKIIGQEMSFDSGEVQYAKTSRIGYLSQHNDFLVGSSVYSEMMHLFDDAKTAIATMRDIEAQLVIEPDNEELHHRHDEAERIVMASDYFNADTRIKKLLSGFGFAADMYERQTAVLSGGEATRLRLAKLLLNPPDILLLDEPTNHLDFATLAFLEQELLSFKGAVISVTHDRAFIRNVCTAVWEMERGLLQEFSGSLENYFERKRQDIERQQKLHDADVALQAKLKEYIAKNKVRASTAKMAKSREKQLKKLTISEKPHMVFNKLNFSFDVSSEPYKDILTGKGLCVSAGEKLLVTDADIDIKKGEKFIIAGENGAGKSTLLQVLMAMRKPDSGSVRLGPGAEPCVFTQHREMHYGNVMDAVSSIRPKMTTGEIRDLLAKFLFRGEDVFSQCETLSGGESARLRLAQMTLENSNFLIFDEPTNHLDLFTRESLTRALCDYAGTLLIVTHDRYLMEQLECPVLYLHDRVLTRFDNQDALFEWLGIKEGNRKPKQVEVADGADQPSDEVSFGNVKDKAVKRKMRAAYRERLRANEENIHRLEQIIKDGEAALTDPAVCSDHVKLTELTALMDETHQQLDKEFALWEELMADEELSQ